LATLEGDVKKWIAGLISLSFCILGSQNALAQSHLGLTAAGVHLGLVSPENMDTTVGLGAFADLGTMAPQVHLVSSLDFWSKSQSVPFGGDASVRDIALTVRGEFMFPVTSPKVKPFAGGGLGLHYLTGKVSAPGFPTIESSSTKLGLDLGGGMATPLGPKTDFLAELWYGVVDTANQLSIRAGLSFKLGV